VVSEHTPPRATLLLPWLVLIAMLSVTWWQWDHERQSNRKELRSTFEFALLDTVSRIEQRESAYEQMLRGMQGLFASTDLMARDPFNRYVKTLQLDANFSGVQGLGVIQYVAAKQKNQHITAMRQHGLASYALTPSGTRDRYAPIIQNADGAGQSSHILGIDAWADPERRQAMETARDSGLPAITGKLRLVADPSAAAPAGFIMYLPLFAPGKPQGSVSERRANLIGWVYASFHMADFMASLYGKQVSGLRLAIYDGITPAEDSLMYQEGSGPAATSQQAALHANEYMVVAGHTWTLSLGTQAEFEERYGRNIDLIIALFGVGLSLSVALLVRFMVVGRSRALRLANAMTIELRHMAQYDHLTGLPNRALFSDRVRQRLADAQRRENRIALIFIDLDKFKPVNDNYGHAVGDLLLQQVAMRLCDSVRASDTVGRIGGDEFVVLIGDLPDSDGARKVAEKIRESIALPFTVNTIALDISCSLGVAVYPEDGMDEDALTRSADKAMYSAKQHGRNRVEQAGTCNRTDPPLATQVEAGG